jgi:hypothetical protein
MVCYNHTNGPTFLTTLICSFHFFSKSASG